MIDFEKYKITDYIIVSVEVLNNEPIDKFNKEVKIYLSKGYLPQGGIFITEYGVCKQAMIKLELK